MYCQVLICCFPFDLMSLLMFVISYLLYMKDSVKKRIQLPVLINYLRQKQKLIINPHYRYDLRNVIMSLNSQSIDAIKQEFLINENHLNLQKFIWLLRKAVENHHYDQLINYQFTRLFQEIDVDTSNTIEWSEFLEFLSESAWPALTSQTDASGKGALQYDRKILFHGFSEASKYRKQEIKKIIEIQRSGLLGVLTRDNKLEFINYHHQEAENDELQQEKKQFGLQSVDFNKVLSLDYSQEERLFGVLMSNRNICFIEEGEIHKTLGVIRSTGSQVEIYYLPVHKLWAVESVNSTLHIFPSPKNGSIKTKLHFKPHQQPITAIKEISSPLTICTASLDGTIKLWQTNGRLLIELQAKKELSTQTDATKGVKGLATYSRGNISYICSWMFTTELFLWLPSFSLSKPFAGELKGHIGLVINALFTLKGELVSVDDRRMIKVWNPQKFECIQTLVIQKLVEGMFILKGRPYLLVYSKLMQFFRVRTNSKADLQNEIGMSGKENRNLLALSDSYKLIATSFTAYYSSIIIVTNHQAKILEVNTSSILATILPHNEDQQFVAMSMQNMRRVYIASSKGLIYEYKIEDGSLIKKIAVVTEQQTELRFIYFHQLTKILMAIVEKQNCCQVLTYDILGQDQGKIKQIEFNQIALLSFQFDALNDQFFILSQNFLTVWNYQKLNIISKIQISSIIQSHSFEMILQPTSGSLFLYSKDEIVLLRIKDQVLACEKLQLHKEKSKAKILGATVMKQSIATAYLQDLKLQKQMFHDKKKHANFNEQLAKEKDYTYTQEIIQSDVIVLAVTDIYGQTIYYNITKYLSLSKIKQAPISKGKLHHLKQKRIAHMKNNQYIREIKTLDLSLQLFTQQISHIPKAVKVGTVASHFFILNSQNSFYFFNIFGVIKGEWNISLTKPRMWQIAFNQINLVVARLQRAEQVLARIDKVDGQSFKINFLIAKYLTEEELLELVHDQEKKKIASKNSVEIMKKSVSQVSKSQVSFALINQPTVQEQKDEFENVFVRKLQERDHKIHQKKNSIFYQKVQKSLKAQRPSTSQLISSNSVKVIKQFQQKSPFLQQIQNYFTNNEFNEGPLEHSSIKSSQTQNRKHMKSELKDQKLSLFKRIEKVSTIKNRLKSSVSQMAKNFNNGKVQYINFVKLSNTIISAATGNLGRKGKLHLKL